MSGHASNLIRLLEAKDTQQLNRVMTEAQEWLRRNPQQARDALLDEPQLCFALFHIPKILEKRYQEIQSGVRDPMGGVRQYQQDYSGAQAYHPPVMQGQFYNFQPEALPPPPVRQQYPDYSAYAAPQAVYGAYPDYQGAMQGYAQPYQQYAAAAYPQYAPAPQPPPQQQQPTEADVEDMRRRLLNMTEEQIRGLTDEERLARLQFLGQGL
jgi:hypothetical protein